MIKNFDSSLKSIKLTATGVGMVVLDIVLNETKFGNPKLWAGGSCGNVMIILSSLGWSSYPIAQIGKDFASKVILKDMKKWGVKTNFLLSNEKNSTPIVVERIFNRSGLPTHDFNFECPYCDSSLPRSKSVHNNLAHHIMNDLPHTKVFYFDKSTKFALKLAKEQRSHGALIVFEPCSISRKSLFSIGRKDLFKESLKVAHIVKYSGEQVQSIETTEKIPLEIKTLGTMGLEYKFINYAGEDHGWKTISAYKTQNFVDAAGAGDWCTAGIIHVLGQNGFESFTKASREDVEKALRFGQRLSALNCSFEGARGMMYTEKDILEIFSRVLFEVQTSCKD